MMLLRKSKPVSARRLRVDFKKEIVDMKKRLKCSHGCSCECYAKDVNEAFERWYDLGYKRGFFGHEEMFEKVSEQLFQIIHEEIVHELSECRKEKGMDPLVYFSEGGLERLYEFAERIMKQSVYKGLNKVFFRPHRGSFEDSMAERKSFCDVKHVIDYIIECHQELKLLPNDISFHYYCYDERLKTDSYIVMNKRDGYPVGFMEFDSVAQSDDFCPYGKRKGE